MTTTRGTIKRTTDKGFGFIATPDGTEFFFHHSACKGTRFEGSVAGSGRDVHDRSGPEGSAGRKRPDRVAAIAVDREREA